MDLEFNIVLFENEGYATARGNKGVQDILTAKAEAGYIKDGTYPIIFTLHPYCWKWWSSPKQEKLLFSMITADTWLDRPLRKNKPIQQRLIAALEDWQKKHLRANETIKQISHGKHILYHCDVEKVCGDAEIYCFDSVINTMEDHARAEVVTGSSSIKYVQGNAQIQYLGDHAIISNLGENAVVHKMTSTSLIRLVYGDSQVHTMQVNSRILNLKGNTRIGTMDGQAIVDQADGHSVIENVSCGCVVLGFSHDVQIKKVDAGAAVIPLHRMDYYRTGLPFSD